MPARSGSAKRVALRRVLAPVQHSLHRHRRPLGPAGGPQPARVEGVHDLPATRSCTKPASDPHADYWALVTQSVERQPPEAEGCGFKSHPETRAGVVLDVRSTILPVHHSLHAHRLVGPAARRQVPEPRQLARDLAQGPGLPRLRTPAAGVVGLLKGYRNSSFSVPVERAPETRGFAGPRGPISARDFCTPAAEL